MAKAQSVSSFTMFNMDSFWKDAAEVWFLKFENECYLNDVHLDLMKFSFVIRYLDKETLQSIANFLKDIPVDEKYSALKVHLIFKFSKSNTVKTQKPSEILQDIKYLMKGNVTEEILLFLWLEWIPKSIQEMVLHEGVELEKLAKLADNLLDKQLTELSTNTQKNVQPQVDNSYLRKYA